MKLFKITLNGIGGQYSPCYVVANDPATAYQKVRIFLDKEDIGFRDHREMKSIELIAENARYPECGIMLYLDNKEVQEWIYEQEVKK